MFENAQQAEVFAKAFASALVTAQGQKAPVGTPATTGWTHGVGGIFGIAGLDRDVISARITPRGIAAALRVIPSVYAFPEFAYVTGVADDGDAEPNNVCSTCPSATMQGCIQSACFGRICRESRELTVSRAIERLNQGDLDLSLVNDMLDGDGDPFMAFRNLQPAQILNIATMQAMMEVGISMQQALCPMIWQGNPANNVGTGYMEFNGLDILISTGKVDYHTGTTCPALDSDVKNFNYKLINVVQNGNFTIVRDLEYLEAYLYHNADRMNLMPVEWAICMRPELWYELSMIWPVAWMSTRNIVWPAGAANAIGQQVYNIDATRVREMVQEMQSGMFMYINGRRHKVVLDDGILEYNSTNDANLAAGEYASNIYFVPLTYLGGRPGTYLQHKDYRAGVTDVALSHSNDFYWSDAGRFQWTVERVKYCYTLSAQVEPRIVLKVPQLAGVLQRVRYVPRQHFRDPWDDSDYFYKGGLESRTMAKVYPDNARAGVVPTDGHCQE